MTTSLTRIAACATAALTGVLLLAGSAQAAPVPKWKCEGGSSASPNDPGGRDVRLRLASTNGYGYAEARFIAHGEHIYFDNYAGENGRPFWVEMEMAGSTWKYKWNLGPGYGLHHSYNGSFPEGEKVSSLLSTYIGTGKTCTNGSGRT
ncbi:hypothetical protein [Streptomyces pilosus]|uniref:Uncharacterized protein n=1 Tax=Streptomyces pilosus TaxID=28893 RepID=A0A918BT66_9ACTN|nr:hypothetical protein [Streptomyces pilosus]GGQ90973.1 hypothetical protein GCM10010280_43290 [Streptomyces pilosus]GGV58312.1 hypothetical protein GCM10010261_44860 [Streptomyces pilosus]